MCIYKKNACKVTSALLFNVKYTTSTRGKNEDLLSDALGQNNILAYHGTCQASSKRSLANSLDACWTRTWIQAHKR